MTKRDVYRLELLEQADWGAYLRANSGLPGPRANLELAHAASQAGRSDQFEAWLAIPLQEAPENTPGVFLVVCGVLGLGELLARGETNRLATLRHLADDPRWRVRESVAMALQRWGQVDLPKLLHAMQAWVQTGPPVSLLACRAAAAALCEPALLVEPAHAAQVLALLDVITAILFHTTDRRSEPFRVLRKGLGYCWSVAIVANPNAGKARFEAWLANPDPDLRWMLRENLKKARLSRMDPAWVGACRAILETEK
jgi:hypothetical protein